MLHVANQVILNTSRGVIHTNVCSIAVRSHKIISLTKTRAAQRHSSAVELLRTIKTVGYGAVYASTSSCKL